MIGTSKFPENLNLHELRRRRIILSQELVPRMEFLRRVIREKEQALQNAPTGTVNICKMYGRKQYYLNENGQRSYIKDSDRQLVQSLCQKDYDLRVLRSAQKELKLLEKMNALYCAAAQDSICDSIYEKMSADRRMLIQPIKLSDEEYIKQWETVEYEKKGFRDDAPEYYTEKGERVRSKTEIIIANALKKHEVPYRYEFPLMLKDYGLIHPDFTVLNVRMRKEIYFEHLGMMDDECYREEALRRILAYEKNGIFPGDRLVLTHETLKSPVNSRIIKEIILRHFK